MRTYLMLPAALCVMVIVFISVGTCLADCIFLPARVTTLGPDSFLVEHLNWSDTTKVIATDTVYPGKLLKELVSRYNSTRYCFIGTINEVRHFWGVSGTWWQNIDSVGVRVDTVLKGGGVSSYFWSVDADPWLLCPTAAPDSGCIGLADDNYKSYAADSGKQFLFFADTLAGIRATSVSPAACIGDRGNRIDDSGFVWSDYQSSYWDFYQVKVPLDSFLAAIERSVSIKQPWINEHKAYTLPVTSRQSLYRNTRIFDLHGRLLHMGKIRRDFTGVYFIVRESQRKKDCLINQSSFQDVE